MGQAGDRSRTCSLLFTGQLLWPLSYTSSRFGSGGESCTHGCAAYETAEPLLLHLRYEGWDTALFLSGCKFWSCFRVWVMSCDRNSSPLNLCSRHSSQIWLHPMLPGLLRHQPILGVVTQGEIAIAPSLYQRLSQLVDRLGNIVLFKEVNNHFQIKLCDGFVIARCLRIHYTADNVVPLNSLPH